MQIQTADFLISSPDLESCPESKLPEFAFIGRSNVGKSSLINALTRKKRPRHGLKHSRAHPPD